ncbi:MAG: sugar phosphate isomerase/epimerase [Defluviitaleaceae bacterium]|nr:sugar phosphate isomerase/epimerase [Defluviitaleaceae bacterium]
MKLGISSYSYGGRYRKDEFTIYDAIKHAAETGFDCFEFTDFNFAPPEGESAMERAKKILDVAQTAGIEINAYLIGADFLYGQGQDGSPEKEVERVKKQIDIAKMLGVSMFRHDSCSGFRNVPRKTYKDAIELIAPGIREVAEYAASLGIKTMTENHGYFIQDSHRLVELVKAVNHENYGILIDMGNFLCADENPVTAVENCAPFAMHAHAKDFLYKPFSNGHPGDGWFGTRQSNFLRGTIVGHGVVPIPQCISILKKFGYTGTLAYEFEGAEDVLAAITRGFKYLRKVTE